MKAALHPREEERLVALERYDILDTPTEPEFDDIAQLVASICNTPIAVVNLIANGRQFFKSEIGIGVREMPLEPSICAHAILLEDMMVVPDTLNDERFTDNPLVIGEPRLRFYAGALLRSDDGFPLGTLCVLDMEPRKLLPHQERAIRILGQHVMHLLEMRRARKRERDLRDRLEESLAAQRSLVASVCHDLRTPLNTLTLCSDYLEAQRDTGLHDMARQLGRIGESMSALIDDLQDYRALRTEEGAEMKLTAESAEVIIDDVEKLFDMVAQRAGVELRVHRPPLLPSVRCNRHAVNRMLGNLVQNAIKFTEPGGVVAVRVTSEGDAVRYAVEDTGPGIAPEDLPNLFQPHWRASGSATTPGSGLGLSIVDMLARANDTHVDVESEPGTGSRFSFLLRRAQSATVEEARSQSA